MAERKIAYSIRVEDAGVSALADVAVEELEKLLESWTETALAPRLPRSAPAQVLGSPATSMCIISPPRLEPRVKLISPS